MDTKTKLQDKVVARRPGKVRATGDCANLDGDEKALSPVEQLALIESLLELSGKSFSRVLKAANGELKEYALALRASIRSNSSGTQG